MSKDSIWSVPLPVREAFDAAHPFRLDGTLLFMAYVGSKAHNSYVAKDDPASIDDIDLLGVVVPPPEFVLGLEKFEHWTWQHGEWDVVLYSLQKFVGLLAKANPNVLGAFWLRDEEVLYARPEWEALKAERATFATKAAYPAFAGYARGQLERMTSFTPEVQKEYDYALELIAAAGWTKEQIVEGKSRPMPDLDAACKLISARVIDLPVIPPSLSETSAILETASASVKRIHAKHHMGYMGEKRKRLVRRFGFDVKMGAHLIRLMRMCVEFLVSGNMRVYRTADAQAIREIKAGLWTLDEVKAEAERLFEIATALKGWSPLPEAVDHRRASALCVQTYKSMWGFDA